MYALDYLCLKLPKFVSSNFVFQRRKKPMWSYEKISFAQIFKSVPVNEENTESYEKISFAHIFNFVSVIEENAEFEPW